jgi:hypothetical protein
MNAFSARMLSRSPLTWRKYAQSLGLWLNFLLAIGQTWDQATEDDAEYFKEWRLTEASNPEHLPGEPGRASDLLPVGGAQLRRGRPGRCGGRLRSQPAWHPRPGREVARPGRLPALA